ncbi:MAG: OmpH family outer membrane protein [Sneathiellales bacterium]|nr:OmpH family outer membrane protein [Sneathiellales bacterium]
MPDIFKNRIKAILGAVGILISTIILPATNAFAQEKLPEAKVAVVDIRYVLAKSQTWQNAQKDIQGKLDQIRDAINAKKTDLDNRIQELTRQQTILAPDVYQQKARALQREQLELQREAQNSRGEVNKVLTTMRLQLRGVITQIASKTAKEKGLNIGFDVGAVLFYQDSMNITEEVLKRFNATKTKIEVTDGKKK